MDFNNSERLAQRLRELVPGGGHTYAKGADQYPQPSPAILTHGLGSHVWDADGNEFIEYGMGLRAVGLGHAYPSVVDAVRESLDLGTNFTRPAQIELECAETILRPDPQCGDGEVHQGRLDGDERGAEARSAGHRPRHGGGLRRAPVLLLRRLVHRHHDDGRRDPRRRVRSGRRLHATTTSQSVRRCSTTTRTGSPPCSSSRPAPSRPWMGSSRGYARLCTTNGAVLVFDEMITGFRYSPARCAGALRRHARPVDLRQGARQRVLPVGAVRQTRVHAARQPRARRGRRVPAVDDSRCRDARRWRRRSPRWTCTSSEPVIEHLYRQGERLVAGMREVADQPRCRRPRAARRLSVQPALQHARPGRPAFTGVPHAVPPGDDRAGACSCRHWSSATQHTDADIDRTLDAIDGALQVYAKALVDGTDGYLVGRPSRHVFDRRWK